MTDANNKLPSITDGTASAADTQLKLTPEAFGEAMDRLGAELAKLPIAYLLSRADWQVMTRSFIHHEIPRVLMGIPVQVVPGLLISVMLMVDGSTKPVPRKDAASKQQGKDGCHG